MSMIKTGVAVAILALSSSLACAQQGYVGASYGQSDTDVPGDQTDDAYKLYVGYDFNRMWGVEGGYANLGEPGYAAGRGEQDAWFVAGKGTFPVGNQFNLFGKLGATRNELELNGDHSRTDWLVGVGAEYAFNNKVGLRLEYEDFGKFGNGGSGKPRANMWSLGVTFKAF